MPKNDQIWPEIGIFARPYGLIWCPVGGLVGGCGAGAVSRKTPIYFITIFILVCQSFCLLLQEKGAINIRDQENQLFVGRKEC